MKNYFSVTSIDTCTTTSYYIKIKLLKKKELRDLLNIIIISNAMCYTMLCMLERMRKGKHRIGTPRTQGLRGSALTAYIHEGIP